MVSIDNARENFLATPCNTLEDVFAAVANLPALGQEVFQAAMLAIQAHEKIHHTVGFGHGLKAIMQALHCGKTKAQEIKNSGIIDGAISQQQGDRYYLVDMDKARELYCKAYPRELTHIYSLPNNVPED